MTMTWTTVVLFFVEKLVFFGVFASKQDLENLCYECYERACVLCCFHFKILQRKTNRESDNKSKRRCICECVCDYYYTVGDDSANVKVNSFSFIFPRLSLSLSVYNPTHLALYLLSADAPSFVFLLFSFPCFYFYLFYFVLVLFILF